MHLIVFWTLTSFEPTGSVKVIPLIFFWMHLLERILSEFTFVREKTEGHDRMNMCLPFSFFLLLLLLLAASVV